MQILVRKDQNRSILGSSGRVRLGLSSTTAGSCLATWPIRILEKTAAIPAPRWFSLGTGRNVAAHPVAQLNSRIFLSLSRCNLRTTHVPPRTLPFHTTYDGEGRRVKKVTDLETTIFVYSGGKLIAEYSTQTVQNPTVAYTTTDHLGTPRVITDAGGNVKSRRDYMPFGEDSLVNVGGRASVAGYSNPDNIRQKFTGYQKDNETSLDFAEARMYENRFGRFTAVDPLLASGKSANPQTFNRYVYTSNNPVDRVDVDGKDWVRVKHTRVTYGKTYTTYQPVWKDKAYGADAWANKVYRVGYGKDRGKWVALDPYNNRSVVVGSQAAAVAAYKDYISQRNVDVAAGAVQPAVDTLNVAEALATRGASLG